MTTHAELSNYSAHAGVSASARSRTKKSHMNKCRDHSPTSIAGLKRCVINESSNMEEDEGNHIGIGKLSRKQVYSTHIGHLKQENRKIRHLGCFLCQAALTSKAPSFGSFSRKGNETSILQSCCQQFHRTLSTHVCITEWSTGYNIWAIKCVIRARISIHVIYTRILLIEWPHKTFCNLYCSHAMF